MKSLTLVAVIAVLFVSGCASAPAYRPVGPPIGERTVEAGAGVHGVVGQDVGGVGAAGWVTGKVAKDIQVVARAHHTELIPYAGYNGFAHDSQYGGSAGVRGLYRINDTMLLGGEATADYLELRRNDGTVETFVSGVVAFPVAQQLVPSVWVYAQPTIGAGPRWLNGATDPTVPFGGFLEVPLGMTWQVNDQLVLVAEGGFAIPFTAGYLGLAASYRW